MVNRRRSTSARNSYDDQEKQKSNAVQPVKRQVWRTEEHDREGCEKQQCGRRHQGMQRDGMR